VARYGVNILMRTAFRLGVQHFGNTHYYESGLAGPQSNSTLEALLDDLVVKYKARHANTVTFVRGRVWSQVGNQAGNNMLVDKTLSGTGSQTPDAFMDKERAYLVKFRAGIDTKGRPVYLRKWWHLCCSIAGGSHSSDILAQAAELPQTSRDSVVTFGNAIKSPTVGSPAVTFDLVAKNGRAIDGGTTAHRFLEHHQLGDEWRGS
jgi:hypothetical protein